MGFLEIFFVKEPLVEFFKEVRLNIKIASIFYIK